MKKAMVILFFFILTVPHLLGKAVGADILTEEERRQENRTLAEWPRITEESWKQAPEQIEAYINDHAPWRGKILDAYATFNWNVLDSLDNRAVIKGKEDWLYFKNNDSMEDSLGLVILSEENMQQILATLLAAREKCTSDPDRFVLLIAPGKQQVYGQYMPDCYRPATDTSTAKELVAYIRGHSDLKVVYPLEDLKRTAKETGIQLFYKTDTHWSIPGGYVGVQAVLAALGEETDPLSEVEIQWYPDLLNGDLRNQIHLPKSYIEDPYGDISAWSAEKRAEERTREKQEGKTDTLGSQRLVFVGDSFRSCMLQGFERYFDDIYEVNQEVVGQAEAGQLKGDIFVYEIVERCLGDLERYERLLEAVSGSGAEG